MAMVLHYHGIRGDGSERQLEDQIYKRFLAMGLSRHDPYHIKRVLESYPGIQDDFTERGRFVDIHDAILQNKPVIIHGYFTPFGHIVVIRGYDNEGFFVNDPYGEFFLKGRYYRTDLTGRNKRYSKNLIAQICSPESARDPQHLYIHRVGRG